MCKKCQNPEAETDSNDLCIDCHTIETLEQNVNNSDMPSWMFELAPASM